MRAADVLWAIRLASTLQPGSSIQSVAKAEVSESRSMTAMFLLTFVNAANPELRNLFHRVIRLLKVGSRPLFVFDGPKRPSVKRNVRIYRGENIITTQFKAIIEAFGAEWRTAPGEAEAELAMLNSRGDIDLIISDDVDSLLFGASSVRA